MSDLQTFGPAAKRIAELEHERRMLRAALLRARPIVQEDVEEPRCMPGHAANVLLEINAALALSKDTDA